MYFKKWKEKTQIYSSKIFSYIDNLYINHVNKLEFHMFNKVFYLCIFLFSPFLFTIIST